MIINIIESFIKYFAIIICSLYTYKKLLNLNVNAKNITIDLIFATFFSSLIYLIKLYGPPLAIFLMILSSIIFITYTAKIELGLSITTTIISFGISYTLYVVSALFTAVIFKSVGVDYSNESSNFALIYLICVTLIQLLLSSIPFRFRRLKRGMPFLRSKGGSNAGVFISVFLLCCAVVMNNSENADLVYVIPVVSIIISGMLILFWWRSRLKKAYIAKLRTNEILSLQNTINEKDAQIERLDQNNDFLAKIIHRDNKLIPAMELAVRECLQACAQGDTESFQIKGQLVLEHLETISRERSGIIEEYQSASRKLPLTDVVSIDILMAYMLHKAKAAGTDFELTISGSVKYLVENIISETDLNTLLADLVENAMIATKSSNSKRILVSISISEGHYLVDIFDSGIPFEVETIVNIGLKKITTHADSGGSGIGLATAFEIFKKHNASFIIEEFADENSLFTKKVSVKFDNLNQYIIKTMRSSEIKAFSQREDLIVTV